MSKSKIDPTGRTTIFDRRIRYENLVNELFGARSSTRVDNMSSYGHHIVNSYEAQRSLFKYPL